MNRTFKYVASISGLVIFLAALLFVNNNGSLKGERAVEQHTQGEMLRVSVLNGCGREGLATLFADKIRGLGYDVVNGQGGNSDSYDFPRSVILARKGNMARAKNIADDLGIKLVIDQYAANPYVIEDVVVILGRDWNTLSVVKEDQSDQGDKPDSE